MTLTLLFPDCFGHERTINNCDLSRRRMGSGVCDLHPNLGIKCLPFHSPDNRAVQNHWRGLRFESAPHYKQLTAENTLYVSYSKSVLRHVEVVSAGQGRYRGQYNLTSAIGELYTFSISITKSCYYYHR